MRVAGVTLVVRAPRATPVLVPSRLRAGFLARRGADITLDLVEERPPLPEPGSLLFDSGGVWRVHRHGRGWLYVFETEKLEPALYKAVSLDRTFRRGRLYFPRPTRGRRPPSALEFPLDELLFQHYLARHGQIEVHGCAVEYEKRVLLFCGVSGAGKTTTADLWRRHRRGARILSDDRVVLKLQAGRPWAYGTPWHGSGRFALPDGRPLAAVFFLEHAAATEPRPLTPASAAAVLFARSFPPPWDRDALARVLATCERVVRRVPCFRFGFRPDRSAVEAAAAAAARK
jgi:hypothetical protein